MMAMRYLGVAVGVLALEFAASAATFELELPATYGPDNPLATGITVSQGQYIQVTADGLVDLNGNGLWSRPVGVSGQDFCHGMSAGAVGSCVSGIHVAIEGGKKAWAATHSGELKLYVSDCSPENNLGAYTVRVHLSGSLRGDNDGDGLSDGFEDALLTAYAPLVMFDASEQHYPATWHWHARLSSVQALVRDRLLSGCVTTAQFSLTPLRNNLVPFYPEWHIARSGDLVLDSHTASSNVLDTAYANGEVIAVSPYHMGHDNDWRMGEPVERLVESDASLGLYGRVAVTEGSPFGTTDYRITLTYMQNFSYSDTDPPEPLGNLPFPGSHEGDWEFLDVVLEANPAVRNTHGEPVTQLKRIRWWAHGSRIEWRARFEPLADAVRRQSGSYGMWYDFHNACSGPLGRFDDEFQYVTDGRLEQLVPIIPALVQSKGHGFFPRSYMWMKLQGGYCWPTGSIWGDGIAGRPWEVANVGEVFRPRLGQEVVVQYTGRWGAEQTCNDNPRSPTQQSAGDVPKHWAEMSYVVPGSQQEAIYVGDFDHGREMPGGRVAPVGRISWPFTSLTEALSQLPAPPDGGQATEVIVFPGEYAVPAGGLRLTTPTRLRAPHGNVIIGLN